MSNALNILKEVFGYPAFRGQQAEVIEHIARGGDIRSFARLQL